MILNLTQHAATDEQRAAGAIEVAAADKKRLTAALTFNDAPTLRSMLDAVRVVADMADVYGIRNVMVGCAPWLQCELIEELEHRGYSAWFAFSRRESVDQPQPDGSVRKVAIFRHVTWIHATLLSTCESFVQ